MSIGNGPRDSEKDEAYRQGYDAARNGNFFGDIAQSFSKGLTFLDGPHQDLHDKGYDQGVQDRMRYGRIED